MAILPAILGSTVLKMGGSRRARKKAERAERQAVEDARLGRVEAQEAAQFSQDNAVEEQGNVVLGAEGVDETLEEQLRRLRA
jgi:hypothetical protein